MDSPNVIFFSPYFSRLEKSVQWFGIPVECGRYRQGKWHSRRRHILPACNPNVIADEIGAP
jgi:hypothetical protein